MSEVLSLGSVRTVSGRKPSAFSNQELRHRSIRALSHRFLRSSLELKPGPLILARPDGVEPFSWNVQFPANLLNLCGNFLFEFLLQRVVIDAKWESFGDGLIFDDPFKLAREARRVDGNCSAHRRGPAILLGLFAGSFVFQESVLLSRNCPGIPNSVVDPQCLNPLSEFNGRTV